jgi:hypothetical protein
MRARRSVVGCLVVIAMGAVLIAGCARKGPEPVAETTTTVVTPPAPAATPPAAPAQPQVTSPAAKTPAAPLPGATKAPTPAPVPPVPAAAPRKASPAQPATPASARPTAPTPGPAPAGAPGLVVVGTVTVVSYVPQPNEAPYDTCVTFIKYHVDKVESGEYAGQELLAVLWGLKDRTLMPAARFTPGQRHRLILEPFSKHPELARVMQADDTGEYKLQPYWVVTFKPM